MISSIIFDIGNVLLPFDYNRAATRLIELNQPPSPPNADRIITAKSELESGRIDRAEFLARARPEFNHTGSDEKFLAIWEDIFEPNPPLYSLIERLSQHYPLYLLSNISDIHRESTHRQFPIFKYFKKGVYSYEVGLLKPDPKIFDVARQILDVTPSETLYIDDIPENIQAAREAGFVTVLYDYRQHPAAEAEILRLLGPGNPQAPK